MKITSFLDADQLYVIYGNSVKAEVNAFQLSLDWVPDIKFWSYKPKKV